ncbi:inositol monophosphatase [Streptosporangium violaceochromogenes]|nr:inositol monophosphatase [Streptosporangium violaceochromogenes]
MSLGTPLALQSVLGCAVSAAVAAGEAVARRWSEERPGVHYKNGVEPVSAADLLSDKIITRAIGRAFPGHRVMSEETVEGDWRDFDFSGPLWVIDPIDGTANYVRGHPHTAVSVAFAVDGEVRAGAVHAPFSRETFTAVKGQGARLNGRPITVATPADLARSVVSTGFPHLKDEIAPLVERVRRLLTHCADIRRSAAPTLDIAWVGAGRLDAHTETLFPWDVAAAALIATEAGAVRSHLTGPPPGVPADLFGEGVVVSAPSIHTALVELLSGEVPAGA